MDQTTEKKRTFKLTATYLKYIAVLTMLFDHIAAVILEGCISGESEMSGFSFCDIAYWILRVIGRTAFPIFCFFLVEGFFHTRSVKRYMGRLFLFALLSEIPYDLAFHKTVLAPKYQNVFFTLLFGLCALCLLEAIQKKEIWSLQKKKVLRFFVTLFFFLLGFLLGVDYYGFGILLIIVFYFWHDNRRRACIMGYLCLCYEVFSFPAFFLLYRYQGERGKGNKYFFYLFYPVHLVFLVLIRWLIKNG